MRPCFAFSNADNAEQATLSIYDEIGFWGVQAKDFVDQLRGVKAKTINVEINSPGGDVYAGLAIYNALRASGKEIVTKVMGVAASAASLIAMAGEKRVMPKNTFMMVHNPWTFAVGNADELRDTADTLDKIGGGLLQTYVSRTGQSEDDVKAMLATDTWLTADEALEKGFATEVTDDIEAKAKFDMDRADLPENVKAVFLSAAKPKASTDPDPEPGEGEGGETDATPLAEQIAAYAKAQGLEAFSADWAVNCTSMDEAKTRATAAREIKALCAITNNAQVGTAAIKANKSVADVRAELAQILAKADEQTHTSTSQKQGQTGAANANSAVSTKSIWDSHRKQTAK